MEEYFKLKNENKKSIIMIKKGLFYNAFYEDAIMMSYLMNYKIYYNNDKLCISFPDKSLSLVLSRLRVRKISYVLINKEVKEQFMGLVLEYNNLLKEATKIKEKELLIDKINNNLKMLDLKKIKEIYEIIERK